MSKKVYLLEHSYDRDGFNYTKNLGIYSSVESVQVAIEKYKKLEGFRNWPNDFRTTEFELEQEVSKSDKIPNVFLIEHSYDEYADVVKYVGVFFQKEIAEKALQVYVNSTEFNKAVEAVYIDEYELDKMEWTEGFVTITYN